MNSGDPFIVARRRSLSIWRVTKTGRGSREGGGWVERLKVELGGGRGSKGDDEYCVHACVIVIIISAIVIVVMMMVRSVMVRL